MEAKTNKPKQLISVGRIDTKRIEALQKAGYLVNVCASPKTK
jgi:hypothetical protein